MPQVTLDLSLEEMKTLILQLPPQELLTLVEALEARVETLAMMQPTRGRAVAEDQPAERWSWRISSLVFSPSWEIRSVSRSSTVARNSRIS